MMLVINLLALCSRASSDTTNNDDMQRTLRGNSNSRPTETGETDNLSRNLSRSECVDTQGVDCASSKTHGYCQTYVDYMQTNCASTCKFCGAPPTSSPVMVAAPECSGAVPGNVIAWLSSSCPRKGVGKTCTGVCKSGDQNVVYTCTASAQGASTWEADVPCPADNFGNNMAYQADNFGNNKAYPATTYDQTYYQHNNQHNTYGNDQTYDQTYYQHNNQHNTYGNNQNNTVGNTCQGLTGTARCKTGRKIGAADLANKKTNQRDYDSDCCVSQSRQSSGSVPAQEVGDYRKGCDELDSYGEMCWQDGKKPKDNYAHHFSTTPISQAFLKDCCQ